MDAIKSTLANMKKSLKEWWKKMTKR